MKNLKYTELKLQEIYKNKYINAFKAKNLFKWRTRTMDLKNNYKSKYTDLSCLLCLSHIEKNETLLSCQVLKDKVPSLCSSQNIIYEDLFGENVKKLKEIGDLLDLAFTKRNELLANQIIT